MGGFFGVVSSNSDCVSDLFYGTDYHSHLGTMRGGLAVCGTQGIVRYIHDITNSQFRSKFEVEASRRKADMKQTHPAAHLKRDYTEYISIAKRLDIYMVKDHVIEEKY